MDCNYRGKLYDAPESPDYHREKDAYYSVWNLTLPKIRLETKHRMARNLAQIAQTIHPLDQDLDQKMLAKNA